jgi:hypothetical protein
MEQFPPALAAALVKAQGAFKPASKDRENPAFRTSYATLSSIVESVRAPLASNGLGFMQPVDASDGVITVSTILVHSSGESWQSPGTTVRPSKPDAQGVGSAITYARRYDLCAVLGIVADDDDDGNAASVTPAARAKPAARQPESRPQPAASEPDPGAPIDVEALRRVCASRGVDFAELESDVEKPAADWLPTDRPEITKVLARLSAEAAAKRGGGS